MNWIETYRSTLKMKELEEIPDLLIYRPAAFMIVRLIYPTSITPNQVSLTAIVMGLTAGVFYAGGDQRSYMAGALFFLMFNILDCADGQLARLKRNGTPAGRIIDGVSDYIATAAVFTGIAIGFALQSGRPAYWMLMLVLTALSTIVHSLLVDYYRLRFSSHMSGTGSVSGQDNEIFRKEYEALKGRKGKAAERLVLYLYLRYTALQDLLAAKKEQTKAFVATPEEYYRKNRLLMRLWLFIGPTMQVTNIIVCSLIGRFDIFIWVVVAGFNTLALVLWIAQKIADSTYKKES
ncbi:MAG: CDP-alcohol phosphatidyltransferase family protein [Bacteroidales bacterium]|nr:CDP-alcohol phosphatidyltransferase family protein [Bacteroidales bacterium]